MIITTNNYAPRQPRLALLLFSSGPRSYSFFFLSTFQYQKNWSMIMELMAKAVEKVAIIMVSWVSWSVVKILAAVPDQFM